MVGTKAGGQKAKKTNYEKYGPDFYRNIGRKGGQNGHTGGFASDPEFARICGAIGGHNSSRAGIKNGAGKTKPRVKKAEEPVKEQTKEKKGEESERRESRIKRAIRRAFGNSGRA